MIVIGAVNAAKKPFWPVVETVLAWSATCPCRLSSHWSAVWDVGSWKAEDRSANGSSIEGRVLKNSTPAEKSLMVRPEYGSRRMPPGTSMLMKAWSGPSSLRPTRSVKPAMPAIEKPPCRPR